jgi:probable DNA metabolism protein
VTPPQAPPALITQTIAPTFAAWRATARSLLARDVDPAAITWIDDAQSGLWTMSEAPASITPASPAPRVPPEFLALAELAAHHRDPARWSLLYRLLHRLTHGEPDLLARAVDPDVTSLRARVAAVRRDEHKMHAFVRFRRVVHAGDEHFVAWHRPDHRIVPLAAPFFARRFANMRWTILTPDASASWDGEHLHFGPGAPRSAAPAGDDLDDLFLTYYRSTFNPARLNLRAMRAEMPRKHWASLPEAGAIAELVREAPARTAAMLVTPASASAAFVPAARQLPVLRDAAAACRACDLAACATRTVFGEGPQHARLMLVGEQPGEHEDLEGRPFLGPAGRLLDDLLAGADLDRRAIYVTNAVKHFKHTRKGTRRIHARPSPAEVTACRAWLDAEIEAVRPAVIVCLGSTAARSFLGPRFNAARGRGRVFATPWAPAWLATLHPAAVLRTTDDVARGRALAHLQADLRLAAAELRRLSAAP